MEIGTQRHNAWDKVARQIGVAKALLSDIQNDYMESFEELVHGDMLAISWQCLIISWTPDTRMQPPYWWVAPLKFT